MEFAEIIFHIILLLVVVYIAVLALLLLFLTGANLLKRQTGKPSFFQKIKQQLFPGATNADFILHLAGRVLFHAVLFTTFIALLINVNTVRSSPLFLSLVVLILLIRLAETFTPAANGARHYRRDEDKSKITSWVLGISFFTNFIAPILEWRYQAGAAAPATQWWNWLGLLIFVAGALVKLRAMQQAGEAFIPHVKTDAKLKLVTGGPYALVRHPAYLGLGLSYLGLAILFNSRIGLLALAVLVLPAIVWRITKEEELLATRFGEAWKKYASQAPARLIPKAW
jgi:protein-S-isoprenylcysteine O-methyltransferase Ste14